MSFNPFRTARLATAAQAEREAAPEFVAYHVYAVQNSGQGVQVSEYPIESLLLASLERDHLVDRERNVREVAFTSPALRLPRVHYVVGERANGTRCAYPTS